MSSRSLVASLLVLIAFLATPVLAQKGERPRLTTATIRTEDFLYKKTPQGDITLHGFFPEGWKDSDKRPVIVFFFGGGWKNGQFSQFVPQAEYFASRGLVALAADYRIASKHQTTPDVAVEDAKSAIRWVRANAARLGIDPGKVIASGGSAGGHLAAATALVSKFDAAGDPKESAKPNALVLFNPFLDGMNAEGRTWKGADGSDITRDFSPTRFLSKTAPPTIQFFGTADRLLEHGKDYTAKATDMGVRAELYTAETMGHGFFNRSPWTEVTTKAADEFLTSLGYLEGNATITLPASAPMLKKVVPPPRPNVVILYADDLGYGDLGCYGSKTIRTPHIDRLAREGTRFTSFYVAQPVCTASRAALLTGCYSNRVSMFGALNHQSTVGLSRNELLMPEMFKKLGYATAIFGKWHVGDRPPFRPLARGFDEWLGLPYSNDNGPLHPTVKTLPPLPLYDGDRVAETNPDQAQFTRRFTDRAVAFIEKNKDRPFFLYVPHVMPHVPIFASPSFKGSSGKGLYADVVEELDNGVGDVLTALRRNGLEENTIVIFASDNGPFLSYGSHAGSAAPLREGKLTTWEGGVRVPGIVRWPGKVPADRVCETPVMTIDLLPTFAKLIGGELSKNVIDGKDIAPILRGEPDAKSPHEAYYFYAGDELHALRAGDWKLHLPHEYLTVNGTPGTDGKPANFAQMKPEAMSVSGLRGIASRHGYRVEKTGLALYNLRDDPVESKNVADANPEVVKRLLTLAEKARADLGDSLTGRKGPGVRPCDNDN